MVFGGGTECSLSGEEKEVCKPNAKPIRRNKEEGLGIRGAISVGERFLGIMDVGQKGKGEAKDIN